MLAASEPTSPRTVNGRRLTAASLQREHEYLDWLATRPQPEGDVPPPDESWTTFMAERRASRERIRLQQVAASRKEGRWQRRHGHSAPLAPSAAAQLPAGLQDVEAYVNERRATAHEAGRRCAPDICLRRHFPQARRKEKERLRLLKVTEKRRQEREAARQGLDVPRRGRPPDPATQQRRVEERAQREQQLREKAAARLQRKEQEAAQSAQRHAAHEASRRLWWEEHCQGSSRPTESPASAPPPVPLPTTVTPAPRAAPMLVVAAQLIASYASHETDVDELPPGRREVYIDSDGDVYSDDDCGSRWPSA